MQSSAVDVRDAFARKGMDDRETVSLERRRSRIRKDAWYLPTPADQPLNPWPRACGTISH